MNEIPRELDESACIDGCGTWGIFLRIIAPLMKPAVATFPTLFMYIFLSKKIQESFIAGTVKG